MAGPVIALQFIFVIAWIGLIVFLLGYAFIQRRTLKKSIPSGLLFFGLTLVTLRIYHGMKQEEHEASKIFLGDYKLAMLDRKECKNCKVRLKEGYVYDILSDDKVVGQGKWHSGTASDIPGRFLKIDCGPNYVVWEKDRLIEFIDRTKDK